MSCITKYGPKLASKPYKAIRAFYSTFLPEMFITSYLSTPGVWVQAVTYTGKQCPGCQSFRYEGIQLTVFIKEGGGALFGKFSSIPDS